MDNRDTSRLLLTFGGQLSHDIEAGISHFVATEIPVWLLRKNQTPNVSTVKFKFVHPRWLVDSITAGVLLPTDNYKLRGDINRQTLDSFSISSSSAAPVAEATAPPSNPPFLAPALPNPPSNAGAQTRQVTNRMLTSAENPNFVREYFENSRLHHLSAWKAKFQEQLGLFLQERSSQGI